MANSSAPQGGEHLLSIPEAARALGVCTRTLSTLRKNGDIRAVPIRGRVLYDPRDLAAYIEKQKGGAATPINKDAEGGGR